MASHDIIVIGGSSGSTDVLKAIVGALPAGLRAAVFIVTHVPARGEGYLVQVLGRLCALPVQLAEDGARVRPGRVYIGPADRHLLLLDEKIRLGSGPRENMARPSIDPLFRSAALTYGSRVIGVVLSGMLNDGASGLVAIEQGGGLCVVQDPADAGAPDMPGAALAAVTTARVAPAEALGRTLVDLIDTTAPPSPPPSQDLLLEVEIAAGGRLGSARLRHLADPVALSCPQCQGVLSEVRGARPLRFRCQVGHAVTGEVLYKNLGGAVEEALRVAMRIMEERTELVRRMGAEAREMHRPAVAELYDARVTEYGDYADTLRKAVLDLMRMGDPTEEEAA